ncbi:probable serine/threonine protein kinase IRE4 isoform X2 [Nymphaea colorata]|uniref:probable serine/threonine protein kinase IRE4 isoform X2 n=1 Tax=Nymphaea colorata TaxID=210225 RepID=UPI00129DAB42|nr:probable serine/threonine protein kinase IRE4 isoform X2 [Nymphaea colorata]
MMSSDSSGSTAGFGIPSGLNPIKTKRGPPSDEAVPVRGGVGSGKLRVTSDGGRQRGIFFRSSRRPAKLGESRFAGGFRGDGERGGLIGSCQRASSHGTTIVEQDDLHVVEHLAGTSNLKIEMPCLNSATGELKARGGSHPSPPGSQCPDELKCLLGSTYTRLDVIKEAMDHRLSLFTREVSAILAEQGNMPAESREMAEELLVLSAVCKNLPCSEFQHKCEGLVGDLSEKRLLCQSGWLKQLFSKMIFILAQYSRLVQAYKEKGLINKNCLSMFMEYLNSVPDIEANWTPQRSSSRVKSDGVFYKNMESYRSVSDAEMLLKPHSEEVLDKEDIATGGCPGSDSRALLLQSSQNVQHSDQAMESNASTYFGTLNEKLHSSCDVVEALVFQKDGSSPKKLLDELKWSSIHEQQSHEHIDGVICRICEKLVPPSHLEAHSYICAFAEKCDVNDLDVNDRLLKFAEILEYIIKCYTSTDYSATCGSPGVSKVQTPFSRGVEGQSPKVNECPNIGVEGMFEDIHEMDTACIDDAHVAASNSCTGMGLKDHFFESLSADCTTPASSTSTPKATQFNLFWLGLNSLEPENLMQMSTLARIANRMASVDTRQEGAADCLDAVHEVQDILQCSHLKALVVDTFGSRIESILREKFLSTGQMTNTRSAQDLDDTGCSTDADSGASTPLNYPLKERTTIDDFEIIKPISKGAFGKVFLSRKRTTGDLFAIKVLRKVDMIRKNSVERILAERNILITVRNPFVVRFFYSFTSNENLYLVMEYLNGGDLFSLLKNIGCLEEDVARKYIAELVLALEYLHSMGIVHRDLKPANILVGHNGHIKLTDFGLSEFGLLKSTASLVETDTGSPLKVNEHNLQVSLECMQCEKKRNQGPAVGTPDYLAPEILLGTEHGCTSDWWSVGIILFEFITGIPPFTAQSPEIIFDNILNQKIPWPAVPGEMSYEARDLISRLLVQDPDQRLGANGAPEVKAHPFFKGTNWETLALQKAAFVPNPDNPDDTSYFVSQCSQESTRTAEDPSSSEDASTISGSSLLSNDSEPDGDECGDMSRFGRSSSRKLSFGSFSFKNLSQLASINYDMLSQNGKDPPSTSCGAKGL